MYPDKLLFQIEFSPLIGKLNVWEIELYASTTINWKNPE
jgi:hypothetical protein